MPPRRRGPGSTRGYMNEAMIFLHVLRLLDPNNANNATLYNAAFQLLVVSEGYYSGLDLMDGINPVTNGVVLLLIAAHFLKRPRNDANQSSFQASAILRRRQYGRIFTSVIVHMSPLHLYFNVLGFGSLTECEESMSSSLYLCLLVFLTLSSGLVHVLISQARFLRYVPEPEVASSPSPISPT